MKKLIILSSIFFATTLSAEIQLFLDNKTSSPLVVEIKTNTQTYAKTITPNQPQVTTLSGNRIDSISVAGRKIDAFTGITLDGTTYLLDIFPGMKDTMNILFRKQIISVLK